MQQLGITEEQRQTILRVALHRHAKSVRLFGSRVRGEARPESDIDLLVEMDSESSLLDVIAIKQELEELLGLPVDVLTEKAISRYFRQQVLEEAVAL